LPCCVKPQETKAVSLCAQLPSDRNTEQLSMAQGICKQRSHGSRSYY